MTPTATLTRAEPPAREALRIPPWFHYAAAAWIGGMLALAALQPERSGALLQEDRFVEWWTAALFAVAGILRLRSAIRSRRLFDGLVALFCLFVAGEEFSWGQRLLGFTPPDTFLQHNIQQELTLHNFAEVFGKPKGVLMLALCGYGVLLPLAARVARGRRLLAAARATAPPLAALPWFAGAVLLLWWYPASYTGEWVEALVGGLFLVSAPGLQPRGSRALAQWSLTAIGAVLLSAASGRVGREDPARRACARAEVEALLTDLQRGAATNDLLRPGRVHKRLATAAAEGYLDARVLHALASVLCAGRDPKHRRHGLDPWGMPYWIRTERMRGGASELVVYSMGPDRRRDQAGPLHRDDVVAAGTLRRGGP